MHIELRKVGRVCGEGGNMKLAIGIIVWVVGGLVGTNILLAMYENEDVKTEPSDVWMVAGGLGTFVFAVLFAVIRATTQKGK